MRVVPVAAAAVVALAGAIGLMPAGAAAAAPTASFSKEWDWGTGWQGRYTIQNTGDTALTSWTLEFDLPAGTTVGNYWNALLTSSGRHNTFTNREWNGQVPTGGSVTFGFLSVGAGVPTGCKINGVPCSGDAVPPKTSTPATTTPASNRPADPNRAPIPAPPTVTATLTAAATTSREEPAEPDLPPGTITRVGAGQVALTFDDGPDPTWTPQLLDLLDANGVTATFCVLGVQMQRYPELVRRIVEAGHSLCDHTVNHPDLAGLPQTEMEREIRSAYDEIVAASGGTKPVLFRAPYGSWTPEAAAFAGTLGMKPLHWSLDTNDWARPGVEAITQTLRTAPYGSVILMHDGGGDRSQTIAALTAALPDMKARGIQFVTP